jgi:hypothetical protein
MKFKIKIKCHLARRICRILKAAFFIAFSFSMYADAQALDEGPIVTLIQYLGFHLDAGTRSYREDLLVPLAFNGPGISLGGIYTRQKDKSVFNIRMKFGIGYLKNRFSHEAGLITLELRPSWICRLSQNERYGDFWGGICIPLQIKTDLGLQSWDDSHLYWLTTYSFGLAMEWRKSVSLKSQAVIRMETPLIGWVSRPPLYRYNKQDALNHFSFHCSEPNRSLHFETVDTYRALFLQILLRHELRRSLLNLGIEFQYDYCNRPANVYILNTLIAVSYQWRIGR